MTTERSSWDDATGSVTTAGHDSIEEATGLTDATTGSATTTADFSNATGTTADYSSATGAGFSATGGSTSMGASGDRMQDAASSVASRAGDVASRAGDTAQHAIGTQVNTQLSRGAEMLDQVAQAVRKGGEQVRDEQPQIAGFADTAAGQVDRAAQFLRENDMNGLVHEVESFARRQPVVFLGGALALGILASRFLKASPQGGQMGSRQYGSSYRGGYPSNYASDTRRWSDGAGADRNGGF